LEIEQKDLGIIKGLVGVQRASIFTKEGKCELGKSTKNPASHKWTGGQVENPKMPSEGANLT